MRVNVLATYNFRLSRAIRRKNLRTDSRTSILNYTPKFGVIRAKIDRGDERNLTVLQNTQLMILSHPLVIKHIIT